MNPHTPSPRRIRSLVSLLLTLLVLFGGSAAAFGQPDDDASDGAVGLPTIEILPIQGFIDPAVRDTILDVLQRAATDNGILVVLQLDSPGALDVDTAALVAAIRSSPVPVAVYLGPRVAQAEAGGTALALLAAAHVSGAAPDARLGPGVPLDLGRDDATADTIALADAFTWRGIEQQLPAATLVPSTGTDRPRIDFQQALDAGLVDVAANGLEAFLVELDGREIALHSGSTTLRVRADEVQIRFHSLGLVRRALHAAATPSLIYFLFLAALSMLLFEWFQPGFGVAGIAALIVLPIAVFGLLVLPVTGWALALLVAGMLALAFDVAIAGLGIPTAAGTAALIVGSLKLYSTPFVAVPGWLIGLLVAAVVGFFVVVITIVLRAQAGPEVDAAAGLVGKAGMVRSILNPEGHAYVDGALWRARWIGEGRKIPVGTQVAVVGTDGAVILVGPSETPESD